VIDRRTFLAGTSAVLLAAPLPVEAQQARKVYKIGYLGGRPPFKCNQQWPRFGNTCESWVGWTGATLRSRRAVRKAKPIGSPALAEKPVQLGVDVIVTQGSPATMGGLLGQTVPRSEMTRSALWMRTLAEDRAELVRSSR
jgi:hypothetical protein